ncbi:hypothetical protein J6590_023738 [Homalodisca vitripennis]|nr:hypothetical protein J6590_023738 [Homalodisca vitripennis]
MAGQRLINAVVRGEPIFLLVARMEGQIVVEVDLGHGFRLQCIDNCPFVIGLTVFVSRGGDRPRYLGVHYGVESPLLLQPKTGKSLLHDTARTTTVNRAASSAIVCGVQGPREEGVYDVSNDSRMRQFGSRTLH